MKQLIGIDIKNQNCIFYTDRSNKVVIPSNITKSKVKRPNKTSYKIGIKTNE